MFGTLQVAAVALLAALAAPGVSVAQGLETLGGRASGLAAFVAVADDASAVAWNPAGLVLGPNFNISLDFGRSTNTSDDEPWFPAQAGRAGTTLIAMGVPPLGLSYYRAAVTSLAATSTAGEVGPDRQNREVLVRSLVTSHLGATVLQSLGDHVTVGLTAKLVRGTVGVDVVRAQTWEEGWNRAEVLDRHASIAGDLDLGVMVSAGRVRGGAVVRNLTEPTFDAARGRGLAMTLERQARVGVAWGDRWPGLARTIVALDVDATRVAHPGGERRDVAAGVERWLQGQQIGVRGGVRASTVGDVRPIVSGGLSYALRAGTYVDAYVAQGRREDRAWGIGARLAY